MNSFFEILKVKQPEISPPVSPAGSCFSTPKFLPEVEDIERLTNENLELKNKICEMENEIRSMKVNHQIEINRLKSCENSENSAMGKYNDMIFEKKILPLTEKCKMIIENLYEKIKDPCGNDTKFPVSPAQEDPEICEFYRESVNSSIVEELKNKVRLKDQQIRKHKEFVKNLKVSLENTLAEHQKFKELNHLQMTEILELKKRIAEKNV
jgi:hypothetical protein